MTESSVEELKQRYAALYMDWSSEASGAPLTERIGYIEKTLIPKRPRYREKREIALDLARLGTDEAINELIRMVEGGQYSSKKWEFYLEDQLFAIEALGESGKRQALDYLRETISEMQTEPASTGIGSIVSFPRAERKLKDLLSFEFSGPSHREELEKEAMNNALYQRIISAIQKLEATVK